MTNLRTLLFTALASMLLPLAASAESADRLAQHFSEVQSIKAEFSQLLLDEEGMVLEEASGEMWLQRPGLFRWDYTAPYEQQIGSDGKTLWMYDKELEQVTLRPVAEGLGRTPAVLLSGEGDLFDQFDVTEVGDEQGLDWLLLVPKEQDTDFKSIRLGFNGNALMAMQLTDSLDQLTSIRFSGMQSNARINRKKFELNIPGGTEVVGERG